ncbi:MAG: hypothetical protein Q4A15_03975 [Prevotellaceae bacterium]|nr:hypothetical protein [Prevotellaceae bacterium]
MKKFIWFRKDVEVIKSRIKSRYEGEIDALKMQHKEQLDAVNYAFDYAKNENKLLREEYESMTKAAVDVISARQKEVDEARRNHDLAEMRFNHLVEIAKRCGEKGRYTELKKFVKDYENGEWTNEEYGVLFSETEFEDVVKEVEGQ